MGSRTPSACCPSFCFKRDGKQGCKPMQTYPTGYAQSHRMAEHIFRDILPRRGMAVREEQIALCHEILDTLYNKEISLCEAGVGIGKTLAYLVACVLWQTNRPDRLKLPVVISTSSVAAPYQRQVGGQTVLAIAVAGTDHPGCVWHRGRAWQPSVPHSVCRDRQEKRQVRAGRCGGTVSAVCR